MVNAAREVFVANGYAATTMEPIAERAGVAIQTTYFTFNNKRTLLKGLVDVAVAGDQDPVTTLERPWIRLAIAEPDAASQLRRHVRGTRDIYRRVGPVLEVVRGAAAGWSLALRTVAHQFALLPTHAPCLTPGHAGTQAPAGRARCRR
jgi:AcrR family transcriptional regulator